MGFESFEFHTDKENLNDMYIRAVQEEYSKIDESWLKLHYKTSVVLVIFSLLVEIAMGVILVNSDMLSTTVYRYFMKFLIIPSGINFICIAIETLIMKSKRFSRKHKIYSVSLIFVGIGFVLFTVHNTFTATYYIFAIAIMLTAIYADYRVTWAAALMSIVSIMISELFLKWDTDKISIFENTHRLGDFLISLFVLIAFSIACMAVIRFERRKNSAAIQKEIERQLLQQSVDMDEMTGIYNRKAFRDRMKYVEDKAFDQSYILAIVDVDKFKNINDTWGHHVGDRCLIEFAKILKEFHEDMTAFRYGGDEFCLLFHDKSMEEAESICGEIKARVNRLIFADYPKLMLTASFGLAAISDQVDTVRLFIHADHALYEAKRVRNAIRVCSLSAAGAETIFKYNRKIQEVLEMQEYEALMDKIKVFEKTYDVMRIVDPLKKRVIEVRGNECLTSDTICHDYWERGHLCDNCISMKAFNEDDTFFKVEYKNNNVFMITAVPVKVKGFSLVVELLKNISNCMLIEEKDADRAVKILTMVDFINQAAVRDSLTQQYSSKGCD